MSERPNLPHDVVEALKEGRRLDAISLLRTTRNIGLAEAKGLVDAYDDPNGKPSSMPERPNLPIEVIEALKAGRRLDAISLLQSARKIGLAEAKSFVDAYGNPNGNPSVVKAVLVVIAVGWALISAVDSLGSLLVLVRSAQYRPGTFVVSRLLVTHLSGGRNPSKEHWELRGLVEGREERLSDPALVGAWIQRRSHERELRRRFPPGTEVKVLYNPEASDTLYQNRALRVLPFVDDLVADQSARVGHWLVFGLSPLLVIWFVLAGGGSRRK
jgi:ribosomal protein L7/L12